MPQAENASSFENPLDEIYAASDGKHLWYLKTNPPRGSGIYHILHHGPGMQTAQVEYVTSIKRLPEKLIALNSELYIIFPTLPANNDYNKVNRSVVRIKAVEYNDTVEGWRFSPPKAVETIASLPGNCRLIDTATDRNSLLVLLEYAKPEIIPDKYQDFTRIVQNPSKTDKSESYLILLKLQDDNWEPLQLPSGLSTADIYRLIYAPNPTLLVNSKNLETTLYKLEDNNIWSSCPVDMDVSLIKGSFSFFSNPGLIFSVPDERDNYLVAYLRDCKVLPIAQLIDRAGIHKLFTLEENISILEKSGSSDQLLMSQINTSTGTVSQPVTLGMPSRISRDDFRRMILIGGLFIAALVMFLSRPDPTKIQMNLPPDTVLAKPTMRLIAVVIDLFPAAIIAQIITDTTIIDILKSPITGKSLDDLFPSLLIVGICILHSTVTEALWGKTLGKWLLNCKVIHIGGYKANIIQIIIRNIMKGIAIIVPPLIMFIYLNPARQRIGDLAARTIVITNTPENEPDIN